MKELILKLATAIGVSELLAWVIAIGGAVVVLAIIIGIIVACAKSKAKKKAKAQKQPEKPAETEQVVEQPVVKEEKQEQPVQKPQEKPVSKTEKAPVKKATEQPKKEPKKLNGKWVIAIKRENEYIAQLLASNGEVMLNSEVYSSVDGARAGINTIKNGVENGKFVVYNDKSGESYFKLKSAGNKLLCAGEIYKTKEGCLSAIESVKRIYKNSPVMDGIVEGQKFIDYTPVKITDGNVGGAKGKWKIEQGAHGGFFARLYANNGQVMLSTEEVSKKAT